MDLDLTGRVAVVTGSTAGIGLGTAKQLASQGAAVVVNGRTGERVEAAVEEVADHGEAHGVAADVSTAEGVRTLVEGAESKAGGSVDVLVNNVAIFAPEPFEEISDERWEELFRVNVLSGIRAARAVMGKMRERGWGRIVFVSSESALNIPPEMIHYGTTKTAQLAVARGLAKELAGTGVTVNSVLPGPTWTEGVAEFVRKLAEEDGVSVEEKKASFVEEERPSSLTGRFASVEEVASMIGYLCSPAASASTGGAHRVDGGIVDVPF
jgi:NAD(P)-dependent dehydrogenase (short-subunit alcohol dehydrogenase family)